MGSRQKSLKSLDSLDWYNTKTSIKQKIEMASTFKVASKPKTMSKTNSKIKRNNSKQKNHDFESIEDMLEQENVDNSENEEDFSDGAFSSQLDGTSEYMESDSQSKDTDPLHSNH